MIEPQPKAVNDPDTPANLTEQADRCRRLARAMHDRQTAEMLERMAVDFDQRARTLRP